jgi:hypothetical protein
VREMAEETAFWGVAVPGHTKEGLRAGGRGRGARRGAPLVA